MNLLTTKEGLWEDKYDLVDFRESGYPPLSGLWECTLPMHREVPDLSGQLINICWAKPGTNRAFYQSAVWRIGLSHKSII